MAKSKVGAWSKFIDDAEKIDKNRAIAVARRILQDGPLNKEAYATICGEPKIREQFLAKNVFAINSDGLYDFESKIVKNAVREQLDEAN